MDHKLSLTHKVQQHRSVTPAISGFNIVDDEAFSEVKKKLPV